MSSKVDYRLLIIVVSAMLALLGSCSRSSLPDEIRTILFEQGRFVEPIILEFPNSVTKAAIEDYKNRVKNPGFLMPTPPYPSVDKNDSLVRFLESRKFIDIECIPIASIKRTSCFAYYPTEKSAPHTIKTGNSFYGSGLGMVLARRKLTEITYANKYETNPLGMGKRDVYGITFTYMLEKNIPEFPDVNTLFTGKAELYKDPDDGQWKVERIELNDNREKAFLQQLSVVDEDAPGNAAGNGSAGADESKIANAQQVIRSLEAALNLYRLDNYEYPTSEQGLIALVQRPTTPEPARWKEGGYIDRLPLDPWQNPYQYSNPGIHGSIDIYSMGPDGRPSNNDDVGNWSLQ